MTDPSSVRASAHNDDQISLEAWGSILLRWRRTIVALGLGGAVLGLAIGLLSRRVYVAGATFIPQSSETGLSGAGISGLALAASQFGIQVPTGGGAWGPPVYVELLRSQVLLEPIALDTVAVVEQGRRRVAVMDLLDIPMLPAAERTERTVLKLRKMIMAREDKKLDGVEMTVTTRWPSVSLALAEKLVRGLNQFNLESRKSQAAAERQFVEAQVGVAERDLREAEDRLQSFLQRNRVVSGSQELIFAQDRLQREVGLRQAVYTSLVQNLEEARIREVRDTPVITVLESPRLPATGKARRSAQKGILGGLLLGGVGVLIALIGDAAARARRATGEESGEFFRLLHEATPRFLRGASRS